MGVYDDVKCYYPMPWSEVQGDTWQSKDTDEQYCGEYEIRADGTLWHHAYDGRWEEDAAAPLGMWFNRDNPRWEQVMHNGEIEIHHYVDPPDQLACWYSIRFWFRDGVVRDAVFSKSKKTPDGKYVKCD